MHKGTDHHLLVPSQYMGGGPRVKVFRGCSLIVGRKWGLLWEFPLKFFWEKCPTRMGSHPKKVCMGCDHLMYAIKVINEVA